MIIKSMSRKVPSFGQLLGYIDRDEGNEQYTLRHNVMGRDGEHIQAEFEANGELLQNRKNGVYLYHEIISITRAQGLSPDEQKDRLMDIAHNYVEARCPDNLVYGGLHEDKDHSYHMHLMISANRAGETGRLRLTKTQFRDVQVQLERHVLQKYPELEQKLAIDKKSDRGRSKNEAELERRTGKRPKREEVLDRITSAFEQSKDRQSLLDALGREGLELYVRGKNLGVIDHESGKRHRLRTLDLETADRVAIRMEGGEAAQDDATRKPGEPEQVNEREEPQEKSASEGEKEKQPESERREEVKPEHKKTPEAEAEKPTDRESDNEGYVKYDSSADLKAEPSSKQNPEVEQDMSDVQKDWKAEMEARREVQRGVERNGHEDERKR